jgi:membrane-associated phospholipid phosphatase
MSAARLATVLLVGSLMWPGMGHAQTAIDRTSSVPPASAPQSVPTAPVVGATVGAPSTTDTSDWPYPLFRPMEYVVTGVVGVAAIGAYFIAKPQTNVHWEGGILFDDAVRSALMLHSQSARTAARTASNVTAVGAEVITIGIDSVIVPIARGRLTMAEQLVLMDAESYAFSSLLTTTTYDLVGRARPSYADCQKNPNFDILCNSAPTASFWSGHTAEAFTAAGLSCAHHAYAHTYGDPTADALGCAGMIFVGAATGTLRVMGDRHYATDVATAAIVGFGFGYGMPTVLHYAWPWGGRRGAAKFSALLSPMSGGIGLRATGVF